MKVWKFFTVPGCGARMHCAWTLLITFYVMVEHVHAAATLPRESTGTQIGDFGNDTAELEILKKRWPDDVQVGCKELRAKRYISDGFCTSLKPIKEVVCAGHCMPIKEQNLPWYTGFTKYWAKRKFKEWRCVEAVTKLKRVQLMCENGETRSYKIKIVKSCRCKSYEREPNRTDNKRSKRRKRNNEKKHKRQKLTRKERRRKKRRLRNKQKHRHNRDSSKSERRRHKQTDSSVPTDDNSKSRRRPIITDNNSPST